MQFMFSVGEDNNKLDIHFRRDPWFGNVTIETKDETLLATGNMGFSFDQVNEYKFLVGNTDKHKIRIRHSRFCFAGGLFPQTYQVFVDEKEVCKHCGF